MKKPLAAGLVCLLLLTASCVSNTPATTISTPSSTTLPTTNPTSVTTTLPTTNPTSVTTTPTTKPIMDPDVYSEQFNKHGVWYMRVSEEIWWDIEVPIFFLSYPDIKLSDRHTQGQAAVAEDLRHRVDDFLSNKDEWVAKAADWSTTDQDFIGHAASFTITSILEDEDRQIICVQYHISTFLGGPHGNYTYYNLTYSRETGEILMLDDIIDTEKADVLYQKLCDALPTDIEYPQEPEPIIKEEFFTDLSKTNNWNFTEKGLCFFFNTYVLAPHAYGTISVVIPYSELTDILLPQYMPQ